VTTTSLEAIHRQANLDWFHTYLGGGPSPWDPKDLAGNRVFGAGRGK
jgi:hypothetical protein